jgi:hypothetical protein
VKTAKDLSREQLERIADVAQRALWLEDETWNPDTEWSWDRVESIAGALIDADMKPAPIPDGRDNPGPE